MPLAEFMLENVSWSIELAIRAAKGESIREPDDMDKEMELFVRSRRGPAPNNSDVEVLDQVFFRHVNPMLDKLDGLCERQGSELFSGYSTPKYVVPSRGGRVSGSVLGTDQWERTKKQYLVRPGFALSDEHASRARSGVSASTQIHRDSGTMVSTLTLSVDMETRAAKGFSFEAAINGKPYLTAINRHRIPYSELDGRDAEVDHTVEAICRCMMDEIDSRSQGPE